MSASSWKKVVMCLFPKEPSAKSMAKFRGSALISALSEWYMGTLLLAIKRYPMPRVYKKVGIAGYERNINIEVVTAAIQNLLRHGDEWADIQKVLVLQADVKKAFDNLHPKYIAKALERRGIPADLIASFLDESSNLQCAPEFEDLDIPKCKFTKAIRQGGLESPYGWNEVMRDILAVLQLRWREEGLGIDLGDGGKKRLTHSV